jgi:hypothetical protein
MTTNLPCRKSSEVCRVVCFAADQKDKSKFRAFRTPEQHPSSSCHHPARSACNASVPVAAWSCKRSTRDAAQPSWWSWPSCGRRAWSDHRNRIASCSRVVSENIMETRAPFGRAMSSRSEPCDIGISMARTGRNVSYPGRTGRPCQPCLSKSQYPLCLVSDFISCNPGTHTE